MKLLPAVLIPAAFAVQAQTVTVQLGPGQVPADVTVTRKVGKAVAVTADPAASVKVLEYTAMHGGLNVDISGLKPEMFSAGYDAERVRATTELAPPSGNGGAFRTSCMEGATQGPAWIAFNDPIANPGEPGRAHLHTGFGNTGLNADTTTESLLSSGNSTCRSGTFNRSAYWVPTMVDLRGNVPVLPDGFIPYYKTDMEGWYDASKKFYPVTPQPVIQELPRGLRMIAGNPTRTTPRTSKDAFDYRWTCQGPKQTFNTEIPESCPIDSHIVQELFFAPCWDGKNIDSPDHKSHMAYKVNVRNKLPDGTYDPRGWSHGECPATHPVRLPQITINVSYKIREPMQASNWAISCDTNVTPGAKRGFCSHGDWWNGWKEQPWVKGCLQDRKDCHAHLTGDGRELY